MGNRVNSRRNHAYGSQERRISGVVEGALSFTAQQRDHVLDRTPDHAIVQIEVGVREAVTETGDLPPGHLGRTAGERSRGLSEPAVARSTGTPKRASRYSISSIYPLHVGSPTNSTSRSTSLSGRASSRA